MSVHEHIWALSSLVLGSDAMSDLAYVSKLGAAERQSFLAVAEAHHVTVRALQRIQDLVKLDDGLGSRLGWVNVALGTELERIEPALDKLTEVTTKLERSGAPITVIKSLDHWPDVGRDVDVYTPADISIVTEVLTREFGATIEPRTWGDRLANKWSFRIPGLTKVVEVHSQRLGQMGEHTALAARFHDHRIATKFGRWTFYVPIGAECVIAATLQRMYRHLFLRICDFANTDRMVQTHSVDWHELSDAAEQAGITYGVATYLRVVSEYVREYRGEGLDLPDHIVANALFGADRLFMGGHFLRVPILPHGAELYGRQLTSMASHRNVRGTMRLCLLPSLASIAGLTFKISGKRSIW